MVGVPLIVPFEELRVKPPGSAGETVKVDNPCDAVGVMGVMALPATKTNEDDG